MCGIGAFSLSPTSNIKPKALGNALLAELEVRGYMTAGFAAYGGDNNERFGLDKGPGLGSRMSLKKMPTDTHSAIFHTRYATKGSIYDNSNNHPVYSPDNRIQLVHNGVIRNDEYIRKNVLAKDTGPMAEVDTAVIPALLAEFGVDGIKDLSGDAAIAWFDNALPGIVNAARIEHSPMAIAYLTDGSKVMASTATLLQNALTRIGLTRDEGDPEKPETYTKHDYEIYNIAELQHYSLDRGKITFHENVAKPQGLGGYGSTMRGATAGGTTTSSSSYTTGSYGSGWNKYGRTNWRDEEITEMYDTYGFPLEPDSWDDEAFQDYADRIGVPERDDFYDAWGMSDVKLASSRFYTTDFEGNQTFFRTSFDLKDTIDEMVARQGAQLLANDELFQGMSDELLENISPLVAVYLDFGHVGEKSGTEYSWGEDPSRALQFGRNTGSNALQLAYSLKSVFYSGADAIEQVDAPQPESSTGTDIEKANETTRATVAAATSSNVVFMQPSLELATADNAQGEVCAVPAPTVVDHRALGFNADDDTDPERPMIRFVDSSSRLAQQINGAFASFNASSRKMEVNAYAKARDGLLKWAEDTIAKAEAAVTADVQGS